MKWNVCYDAISSVLSAFRKVVMMTVTAWKWFETFDSRVSFDSYKSTIFAFSLDIIMILLIILLCFCVAFDFSISTTKAINVGEKYGFSRWNINLLFLFGFYLLLLDGNLWLMFHLVACSSFHMEIAYD